MPNTYLKTEGRIALALARLHQAANFSNLVTRIDGNGFVGALNDRLWFEFPGVTIARDYTWRQRLDPIIFDEIARTKQYVKLDTHTYQGVRFTDEEEKLDLDSYARQILFPQVDALATKLDTKTVTALRAADWAVTTLELGPSAGSVTGDEVGDTALKQALKVKAALDAAGCPDGGRFLIAGANTFVWLVGSKALKDYDVNQATTAFRRGVFGIIAGMEVVDGTGILGDDEFVVVHPSWGVLANVAPSVPTGVTWGVRQQYQGWSLRAVRQYDLSYLSDRSVVSTFTGITEVKDQYQRHTAGTAATANDGSVAGDPIIVDGEPQFTGKNVRGGSGTFQA